MQTFCVIRFSMTQLIKKINIRALNVCEIISNFMHMVKYTVGSHLMLYIIHKIFLLWLLFFPD